MNDRVEIFLDKFKQLENITKIEYNLDERDSAIYFLMQKKSFRNIKNELDLCRETRNLLSHNPRINSKYAVEPSVELIELLDKLIEKIKNPLRASDIMVKREDLKWRKLEDFVRETMILMNKEAYNHIPIMDDNVLVGVFSPNTVFSMQVDKGFTGIDEKLQFKDIKRFIDFKADRTQSYRFIPQDMLVSDIGEIFSKASDKNDRIGMIFVTHNGKEKEKILGIITAWDVASEVD